ncbi:MAG: hypothetical protein ACK4YP_07090 [Myxococcota bacterium]
MPAAYLDWLADVFEEAQVTYSADTADYLDLVMRRLVNGENEDEEVVFRRIRERWLKHGLAGRQLLAAFIRDDVYARRDSPFRPKEGDAYYTNDYTPKAGPPVVKGY